MPESFMYSGLKGVVQKVQVLENAVAVSVKLEDPGDSYDYVVTLVSFLGAVAFMASTYLTLSSMKPEGTAMKLGQVGAFIGVDVVVLAAIFFLFTYPLYGRRTGGKPVVVPLESLFIPGVDKVSDPFWDGN